MALTLSQKKYAPRRVIDEIAADFLGRMKEKSEAGYDKGFATKFNPENLRVSDQGFYVEPQWDIEESNGTKRVVNPEYVKAEGGGLRQDIEPVGTAAVSYLAVNTLEECLNERGYYRDYSTTLLGNVKDADMFVRTVGPGLVWLGEKVPRLGNALPRREYIRMSRGWMQ